MNLVSDMTQPNDPQPSSDFEYTKVDGKVTITNLKNKEMSVAVVIPSRIDGLPVTSIGERAFAYCSGLTSVTIPSSVTSIGSSAFLGCENLTIHAPRGSAAEKYVMAMISNSRRRFDKT